MAKKEKSKKSKVFKSTSYEVSALVPGFNIYAGNILSISANGVEIDRKKPRSPARIHEFIPSELLVAVNGKVGEEGEVVVLNNAAEAYYVEGTVTSSNSMPGFVEVTGEDGTTLVNAKFVNASVIVK